jgi:PEGA domain-containing protein
MPLRFARALAAALALTLVVPAASAQPRRAPAAPAKAPARAPAKGPAPAKSPAPPKSPAPGAAGAAPAGAAPGQPDRMGDPAAGGEKAPADPAKTSNDAAKGAELKEQGDRSMDARRYADAAAFYRSSVEAYSDPSIFYNLGRAYQAMGEYPDALWWLRRFEREAPASLKERVPRLAELLAELRARVTEVTIRSNVGDARVLVRDRFVGTTPFGGPITLGAGTAPFEILAPGYLTYRREHQLKAGGEVIVDIQLAPSEAGRPSVLYVREKEQEGPPGITSRWWFWTGVGVAVVAAGVASYVVLTTERSAANSDFGGAGQVGAPLVRF